MQPKHEAKLVGCRASGEIVSDGNARVDAENIHLMQYDFLATFAHKLRTPLHAMLGWSETLLVQNQARPEMTRGLEVVVRSAQAQAKLIEEVLDTSSILAGKIRLSVEPTNLVRVIQAAVSSVRPLADAKRILFQLRLNPLAGPYVGDAQRLEQIVSHLLSNAVKFTPEGGQVEVKLKRLGGLLQISVRDFGAGLSPQSIPHLFDYARRKDTSGARRHGGLGLGLSVVKKLSELHGGRVQAMSAGPGQGSTFSVILPVPSHRQDTQRDEPSGERTLSAECDASPTPLVWRFHDHQ